jgi:hypothetical protein
MKRHRDDEGIEQRIRRDLAFLFEEYGGVVTSSSRQPAGISEVLVAAGNLEFQFSRNTRDGENLVKVGPRDGLGIWELLPVALAASTGENPRTLNYPISFEDDPNLLSYIGLTQLALVLKPRFERLNQAFAAERYATTRPTMAHIERQIHPNS